MFFSFILPKVNNVNIRQMQVMHIKKFEIKIGIFIKVKST